MLKYKKLYQLKKLELNKKNHKCCGKNQKRKQAQPTRPRESEVRYAEDIESSRARFKIDKKVDGGMVLSTIELVGSYAGFVATAGTMEDLVIGASRRFRKSRRNRQAFLQRNDQAEAERQRRAEKEAASDRASRIAAERMRRIIAERAQLESDLERVHAVDPDAQFFPFLSTSGSTIMGTILRTNDEPVEGLEYPHMRQALPPTADDIPPTRAPQDPTMPRIWQ